MSAGAIRTQARVITTQKTANFTTHIAILDNNSTQIAQAERSLPNTRLA